jgi:guanine nucleotide-binding protein alpha-1 subunit
VQQDLQRRLGAAAVEESSNPGSGAVLPRASEIAIRSRDGWRSALERFRIRPQDAREDARAADARVRKAAEVTEVVVGCAEDMKTLWEDRAVQGMLRRKKIRMEEEPGLYVIILSSSPPYPLFIIARGSNLLIRRLVDPHRAAS